MQRRNYQKELDKMILTIQQEGRTPSLLLHSCCAPCSSYCLEYLSQFFDITVFYYNPNITEEPEYRHRVEEQKRLIASLPVRHPVSFLEGSYEPARFFEIAKGLESVPEGGVRCMKCFRLRLEESARAARKGRFDFFTTTLTISPLKNASALNAIGEEFAGKYDVAWLPSDFKKKDGYKRSIELSAEYQLYRQNYCGCIYSKEKTDRKSLVSSENLC